MLCFDKKKVYLKYIGMIFDILVEIIFLYQIYSFRTSLIQLKIEMIDTSRFFSCSNFFSIFGGFFCVIELNWYDEVVFHRSDVKKISNNVDFSLWGKSCTHIIYCTIFPYWRDSSSKINNDQNRQKKFLFSKFKWIWTDSLRKRIWTYFLFW